MAKEICVSSTPHETRLAILEDDQLTEIYYERENEYTLAGSIYKGRVTRVLPGMQSAFVDLGLERDAFLYVTDFMEEQEDSADFERVSGTTGNGNGGGRRESSPARTPRENGRTARPAISVEPETEDAFASDSPARGEGEESGKEAESSEGTRRWRGRRGRRRGGRPQGSREASPAPYQETKTALPVSEIEIQVEDEPTVYEDTISPGSGQAAFSERVAPLAPATKSSGASQPIVLPGESLSRYGGKPAASAPRQESQPASSAPSAVSSYKPSTLVEVLPTWDGGVELPGESLSRHRTKAAAVSSRLSAPEELEHVAESHLPNVAEPITAIEESPAVAEHAIEIPEPSFGEPATPEALQADLHETSLVEERSEAAPAIEHSEAPAAADEVSHETESTFEPEHASASYRIDTVAPSEYRLSGVLEEEPEVHFHAEEAAAFAPEEHKVSAEQESPILHSAHEATAESGHPELEPFKLEPVELGHVERAEAPEEISAVAYEDTAHPVAEEVTPSSQETHSALEASTASSVIEDHPHVSETEFLDDDQEEPVGFAPGLGTLEEEVIEEEEFDSEPVHAYLDEGELDDLEEETLDNVGGSELGDMVRDTHLEQRISVSPDGITIDEEEADTEYGEVEDDLEDEEEEGEGEQAASSAPVPARRDGRTDDGRRGGRGPRRRGRPNGGGSGSRRANSQLSDLPIISELLKQGQEILVQIAKEPIAKKGARITSHIALPGRFLVFMPTVNHVGVSRKISSDDERQRLKRILISEKGTVSGGFIVRTAADGASEDDLRADIRFLINLWNDIKQRADEGKAPALIYHDLNLIERVLRDQVSANFSTIWVDNEGEYERILRFLQRFEPSLVRRVKLYTKETPLFEQFGIQDEISKALKSKVWLKSGGSIVINQTEALVAIDINTGKYVGKTARLEDTILKTNLDAIPEIVRQIRLRDLGGIIVIDFIDMDDRRNRHKVMAALEEELKNDRAPSKVLQFNDFGLVAITRKRVKQSLERTLSVQCEICAGTGMVKSPTTVCNEIYTELRKMQKLLERGDVLLRVHPEIVKTLKANNAKWLNELEELTGKTIIVKSDPALHPEQFDIH